jgi:PiT family inorganic phosphate transporter
MAGTIILIIVVVAFAWNLGVHYTGAVMGMPHAARAISLWPALVLIGIFTILGATFASGRVEQTVGLHIIDQHQVGVADAIVIVLAAGLLTLFYNFRRVPTSTIQILVFCVVGVGLAGHIRVSWSTIGHLAIVWVLAPIVAFALGFVFTRLLDLLVPPEAGRALVTEQIAVLQAAPPADKPELQAEGSVAERWFPAVSQPLQPAVRELAMRCSRGAPSLTLAALRWLPALLVLVGVAASFVLGANDVSNATGAFIMVKLVPLQIAGLIGGVAMAVGALTWGSRILRTVAFDVVKMDLTMASAAQGVQALVVIAAVSQGTFTSMNQALIGAMAGTGLARGRQTVQTRQIRGILLGWLIGPGSGIALAFVLELIARAIVR